MNTHSLLLAQRSAFICLSCRRSLQLRLRTSRYSSYQAHSLNPHPTPQPRNAVVPESSIAHPIDTAMPKKPEIIIPRVQEVRPPKDRPRIVESTAEILMPEQEAQISSPSFVAPATSGSTSDSTSSSTAPPPATRSTSTAASTASTTTITTPSPRPRSKLRTPRKAAMKLTPAAVEHLRALLAAPTPKLIRVGVRNRGCSGLAYHLEFVERPGQFDEAVEQDGVRVLVDSKALFSIIGSEMDWVEDKLSQRFVFRNPNIKEQCGCGESFMV